ncbi:MAG: ligand-gated channel, partial [Spirochaetia bacterium]
MPHTRQAAHRRVRPTTRAILLAATAGLGFGLVPSAIAQEAQGSEAQTGGIADIVVTARKRQESTQDVPVSVVAISAERIQQYDLSNLERVAAQTPSFSIGRTPSGAGATLTLRGIGSNTTSIGLEQSVAVIVDGAYYGQGRTINEGFFDLARLEILKGPQALFFGKNATAGVVSITTSDPGDKLEVIARAGYEFTAKQIYGEAIVSSPLTDTLGIRVAARASKQFDGYY